MDPRYIFHKVIFYLFIYGKYDALGNRPSSIAAKILASLRWENVPRKNTVFRACIALRAFLK